MKANVSSKDVLHSAFKAKENAIKHDFKNILLLKHAIIRFSCHCHKLSYPVTVLICHIKLVLCSQPYVSSEYHRMFPLTGDLYPSSVRLKP